jgi:hypothetical protein
MSMALTIKQADKVETSGDTLGGFKVWESDAYEATVKAIYIGSYVSGAQFCGLHLSIDGTEYREQITITNKAGENFYTKGDKNYELPGFQVINELCQLTTGFGLLDQEIEDRTFKLYDKDAGGETNQSVPCPINVLNKPIVAGILNKLVNKQVKNDATGKYEDTAETRNENELNKVFHAETQGTVTEYQKGLKHGTFLEEWLAKNKGEVSNQVKKVGGAAQSGRPGQAGPGAGQTTGSLFGNK